MKIWNDNHSMYTIQFLDFPEQLPHWWTVETEFLIFKNDIFCCWKRRWHDIFDPRKLKRSSQPLTKEKLWHGYIYQWNIFAGFSL
jgi:hypothetical protein